jgi:hypothetical protein
MEGTKVTKPPSTSSAYETDASGRPKPCRGLKGVYCGEPRKKNQTYCTPHQAEYQRDRYARIRQESGRKYTERAYTRTHNVPVCTSCGNPKDAAEGLIVLLGLSLPPICATCKTLFDSMRTEFGWQNALKVAEFMIEHRETLELDAHSSEQKFENWFDGQIDKYLEKVEWPEGREDCKDHWRSHFTQEYAKLMAQSVQNIA